MTFDDKLLQKLEKLSMLEIEDSKREEILGQLNEIVSFVENLNELNTDGLDSKFSMLGHIAPLRDDIVNGNTEIAKSIFEHAPKAEDDFFIVDKIIG